MRRRSPASPVLASVLAPVLALGLGLAVAPPVTGEPIRTPPERNVMAALRQAFPDPTPAWRQRLMPDATLATCSRWHNQPPKDLADALKARERARIRYPADGNLLGNWQKGERLAQSGYGLRFTDVPPTQPNGGNCYACHRLAPAEISYGTFGVALTGYGRIHGFTPEAARTVYDKIYDSQAIVACSLMPRFGANGVLSITDITDLVAYLMDPASPVNELLPPGQAAPLAAPAVVPAAK